MAWWKEMKRTANYENDYHNCLHKYLITDESYYKARARLALVKYFKGIPKNSKILEFGCGVGQNIYMLKNAIGYDISNYSLNIAKSKGVNIIGNIKDIKNNSCDVVFSSHVLEHVENPIETLKLIKSKIKEGGKLILVLPVEKHAKVDFNMDVNQHLYAWNFRTINNLLIKAGFKVIKNEFAYGTAYHKLLFVSKVNFRLYHWLTKLAGFVKGSKEMIIVAKRVD